MSTSCFAFGNGDSLQILYWYYIKQKQNFNKLPFFTTSLAIIFDYLSENLTLLYDLFYDILKRSSEVKHKPNTIFIG